MPQGFTDNLSYSSEILKADLDESSFPQVLFCCDMWMICFFSLLLKLPHRKKQHPAAKTFNLEKTEVHQRKIAVCPNPG